MKTAATITMSNSVLSRLRGVAESEKRTVSQQLEMIVESHFKALEYSAPLVHKASRKKGKIA